MINFPRNKRLQIMSVDITECILYGIAKSGTKTDKACVARIRKQRTELALAMFGTERFLDNPKKRKNIYKYG